MRNILHEITYICELEINCYHRISFSKKSLKFYDLLLKKRLKL